MSADNVYQLLATLVPVIISGVVAIVTSNQVTALKAENALLTARIARLEQMLTDHQLPIPPTPIK